MFAYNHYAHTVARKRMWTLWNDLDFWVAFLQSWLQEHSTECSTRFRRILEWQLKIYRNLWNMLTSLLTSLRYFKTLNKNGVHGRTLRKKPLLSKNNFAALLKFAKEHLDVPQLYWKNILRTDETNVELFGRNTQHYVWREKVHQNLIPTVTYGGGSIMVGTALGPGQHAKFIKTFRRRM